MMLLFVLWAEHTNYSHHKSENTQVAVRIHSIACFSNTNVRFICTISHKKFYLFRLTEKYQLNGCIACSIELASERNEMDEAKKSKTNAHTQK